MAAKGYGHFRTRAGVNRRYSRPRMRANTVSRSSKGRLLQTGQEEAGVQPVACTTRKVTFSQPRCVEGTSSYCSSDYPMRSDVRPLSLDLSVFSDHVDMSLGVAHSNASSLTVYDPEAYCRAAPEEDLYGWEVELNRKLSASSTPRRPTPLKRNLLQRVFSLGERSVGSLSRSSTLSDSRDGSPGT